MHDKTQSSYLKIMNDYLVKFKGEDCAFPQCPNFLSSMKSEMCHKCQVSINQLITYKNNCHKLCHLNDTTYSAKDQFMSNIGSK